MKKVYKYIILILIVCLGVAGAFLAGLMLRPAEEEVEEPHTTITAEEIAREISGISEYAVLEYRYTNVGKFENKVDFYGWEVPFTTKSFIITYDGAMKLGIEGGEIQVQVVGQEVRITLPPAKILSHEIFEDTIEVMDQSKNIFNQIEIEDYASFAADQKTGMESKAEMNGLMNEATENARQQLEAFVNNLPLVREEYTVVFESTES